MSIDALEMTKALIRCASVTPEDGGALDTLQGYLRGMGFSCTRLPFESKGDPKIDNLYARLGAGGPYLCFAGHTDVVPTGDVSLWSVPPFAPEVRGEYLIGRGAEDMKGAIACFSAAVAAFLQERGGVFTGSIGYIITGDEEGYAINGTQKMVQWMQANGEIPDACIVGEPTNPEEIGDMVKIGRRGSLNMVLTIRGKQGHVAYPHLADNPVTRMVDALHALKHAVIDTGTEFFPPSNLEVTTIDVGNPAKNVIAAQAVARVNIRFNILHSSEQMVAWVRSVVEKHASPEHYTLEVAASWGAFITPPGALSAMMAAAVKEATGRTPALTTTGGTSDARFIRALCPVVEFGTTGKTAHAIDEKVKLRDLELLTQCYLAMLRRFFPV